MTHISAVAAQRMAYQEMNYALYVTITMIFYGLIVLLAMLLEDIEVIFNFVSAYSISCIAFFIPSIFYSKAVAKFGIDTT